jgi:molybdopterin molybdotransferase
LLRTLGGFRRPHRRTIPVVLDDPIQLGAPLTHFLRVVLSPGGDGALHARLTGAQSSGMLTSMSSADALLIVPPEPQDVPAGVTLRAIPLDGDLGGDERFPA